MNRCFIVNIYCCWSSYVSLILSHYSYIFYVLTSLLLFCILVHIYLVEPFVLNIYLRRVHFHQSLLLPLFLFFFLTPLPSFVILSPSSCLLPVRRVPPRFSIPPTSQEIMPGGSVNITCVAVGSPMPYVKWMLNSEDLTPEDEMPVGRNVLELSGVRESANYTCVAMSSLGIIEAVAQITVKCKR